MSDTISAVVSEPERAVDPSDPYAREAQTFPRLSVDAANRVANYGVEQGLRKGTRLFERGQRGVAFFLVLEGNIEIFDVDTEGQPHVLTVHGERQFTGELDLFNDQQILVCGRTGMNSRVVRVKRADFRKMLSAEPDIGEIVMRAFILRRVGLIRYSQGAVTVIGSARGADTLRLERFLSRNNYPHRLLNVDTDRAADALLARHDVSLSDLPVVIVVGKAVLRNPSTIALADMLGLTENLDADEVFDVAVVGAGPSGLAAAVYAASEGLRTIVLEGLAPGGQAGTSSKIENYLGFPTGISGQALAGRALAQAQKFGADVMIATSVKRLECRGKFYGVELGDGQMLRTRSVVIASGAEYRSPGLPNLNDFVGMGIYYAATHLEAQFCKDEEIVVIGGGNSAGQAAVFLSGNCRKVHMLVRSDGLAASMSRYLIRRIDETPNIELHTRTQLVELTGAGQLEKVTCEHNQERQTRDIRHVFLMMGAAPNTEWLRDCVCMDGKGFVRTGPDLRESDLSAPVHTAPPWPLE